MRTKNYTWAEKLSACLYVNNIKPDRKFFLAILGVLLMLKECPFEYKNKYYCVVIEGDAVILWERI